MFIDIVYIYMSHQHCHCSLNIMIYYIWYLVWFADISFSFWRRVLATSWPAVLGDEMTRATSWPVTVIHGILSNCYKKKKSVTEGYFTQTHISIWCNLWFRTCYYCISVSINTDQQVIMEHMPGFISENIYLFVQLSSLQNETRAITVNESFM